MGEMVQFKRPDGKTCPGYLATPKAGSGAHGFVCIQEYWGLNEQIKKTAGRLAEAGYRALVPDLYRGKVAKAADEASHMMKGLNFPDAAEQDIRGAVQYLKQSSKKVEVGHHVACLVGRFGDFAAVEVRHEPPVSSLGEPVGSLLDLIVEPPPLLNADKPGRARSCFGDCQIARACLPVQPFELNHFTHEAPPRDMPC